MTDTPDQPGKAPRPAPLDADSMAAIRAMMAEAAPAAPAPETEAPVEVAPEVAMPPRTMARVSRAELPPLAAPAPEAPRRPKAQGRLARVGAWRPTPRQVVWTGVALLVLFRPWLVLGLLFLSVILVTGLFLALGYEGFWRRVLWLMRRYAGRQPERAARLQARLDAFAMKWDALLDRFPEGSVDGLYLPDFGEMAAADARHDAALARRLDRLADGEGVARDGQAG